MASYESQLTKKWQTSYPQQTKALLDSAAARLVKTLKEIFFSFIASSNAFVYEPLKGSFSWHSALQT